MKSSYAVALGIVIVLALAGVAGYVYVLPALRAGPTGTLNVYVKDAVGPWRSVNVTFADVEVQMADQGNDSGWRTLPLATRTVDLAALTNVSELLGSATLPAGKYTEIRFNVSAASGVMTNGTAYAFRVPSGFLRTTHPFTVTAGSTTSLTLDVDLSRSIVATANGYLFTPMFAVIDGQ